MKTVDEEIWDTMCKELRQSSLHTWLRRKYHEPYMILEIARDYPDPGIVVLVLNLHFKLWTKSNII